MTSKREKQPHVWVVEMQEGRAWNPCADAFLDKKIAAGYNGVKQWKENNPYRNFRIRKYVRSA